MTATQLRSPGPAAVLRPDDADGTERVIRPWRGLPSGRAVVGGLLVTVAAVGTFAAASGAGRGPEARVVVAARDIAPGSVLGPDDVELVAVDLPARLAGQVFTAPNQVRGAVAVGPLSEGELVQAGGLAAAGAGVPTFSISIPVAAANGGRLRQGDRVQVFATYGSDATATTRLLAGDARVSGVDEGDTDLGASGQIQVILAIDDAEQRSAVLNAATSGAISLVRTTGVADPEAVTSYRPEPAAPTGGGEPAEDEASGAEPSAGSDR